MEPELLLDVIIGYEQDTSLAGHYHNVCMNKLIVRL